MTTNFRLKPVNFNFGEYLSKGIDLIKKDFGNFIVAYIFCIVLSIIPFCGLMAMGNFMKYCRKIDRGENASPSEIFSFDDFSPYIILQLIIFAGIVVIYIPFFFFIPFMHNGGNNEILTAFFALYVFGIFAFLVIIMLKGFYIPGLISLEKVHDFKTAWNMSKVMTKNNLLIIFLFAIVTSFLAQLGIILCIVGILVTMPFYYTSHYFAYEDGNQQIKFDEIKEIGSKNENF